MHPSLRITSLLDGNICLDTGTFPRGHRLYANLNKYIENNHIEFSNCKTITLHFGMIIGLFIRKHVFLTDFSRFIYSNKSSNATCSQ